MRKPTTNEDHVDMSDVLCDFCHREWTEDVPMVEGHRGACVCGNCLSMAYVAMMNDDDDLVKDYACPMCLEGAADRTALGRADEPGWRSPVSDAVICRRCVKQAAGALHKDGDIAWTKPGRSELPG